MVGFWSPDLQDLTGVVIQPNWQLWGGGKKLFSRELCTSNPGTALLSSSITIKLGSVEGALSSSPEDACADEIEAECIEAVVEGGVDEESSVTRVSTCKIKRK